MKFYKCNKDYFGDYDMFIVMSYDEVKKLVEYYGTIDIVSTTFDGKEYNYDLRELDFLYNTPDLMGRYSIKDIYSDLVENYYSYNIISNEDILVKQKLLNIYLE